MLKFGRKHFLNEYDTAAHNLVWQVLWQENGRNIIVMVA